MRFGSAGKIMHTVFVHREKLQWFLLFQQTDKVCFAVGLFAVVQHGLCEDKEVFRSGAGDTQSKLCALQRVADDLIRRFGAVIHLMSPAFSLGEGKRLNESTPGMRARLRPQSQSTWICPASSIHSTVPIEPGGTGNSSSMQLSCSRVPGGYLRRRCLNNSYTSFFLKLFGFDSKKCVTFCTFGRILSLKAAEGLLCGLPELNT